MGAFIDLLGQRFGRLTVIERMPNNQRRQAVWKCICDCGKEVIVEAGHLRSGHTQSCGCYGREQATKHNTSHGMSKTRLHSVYHTMKGRCYNQADPKYYRYGARGIIVCDEWLKDPKSFFDWALSHGYKKGLSIDRIDNNGNYCPENCRWVDAYVQANNKSTNQIYEYNGEKKTISALAKELGLTYSAVKARIKRGNFESLFDNKNGNIHLITCEGMTKSIKEWAEYLNMPYSTVRARVGRGSFDQLFPDKKK